MKVKLVIFSVIVLFFLSCLHAQTEDVHLFQSFFQDARIAETGYLEGGFQYDSHKNVSIISVGFQGGYPINQEIEIGMGVDFISWNPDKGDDESGLSDLLVTGKYNFLKKSSTISAGGYITLPVGSEDIGQSNLNFGFFGSIHHLINSDMAIIGNLSLDFYEKKKLKGEDEYKYSLSLGAGLMYALGGKLSLVPELYLKSENDDSLLSCGLDYQLSNSGKLRGAVGLGLDNGVPDLSLMIGYLMKF
jgi:hypothetical protein